MSAKPEYISTIEEIKSKKNIAFIGFMGSGKSTIAKIISKKSGLKLVDIDKLIVEKTGMKISTIFDIHGEPYFRDIEEEILKQVLRIDGQIISCGGGVILRESNRKLLKERAINCWLNNHAETSISRIKQTSRPLLKTDNPLETAKSILSDRIEYYEEIADIKLDTDELTIDQIVTYFYDITYKTIFC